MTFLQEILGGRRCQGTITKELKDCIFQTLGVSVTLRVRDHGPHAGRRILTSRAPPSVPSPDFDAAVEWVHDVILEGAQKYELTGV